MKKVLSVFLLISMLSFVGHSAESNITDIDNIMETPIAENEIPVVAEENDLEYICNLKSKKFHLSTCHTLPGPKNTGYASSWEEAIADGYTPCQNCNP